MSARDNITSPGFLTGTFTVRRYAVGSVVLGRFTPGTNATFAIQANVQPNRGREIIVGPEGQTNEDVRVVRTTTELRATPGTPDEIQIDGSWWKLFHVETWIAFGGTHYKAYAARQAIP